MNTWRIRIQDPSGETRSYILLDRCTLGRPPAADIPLKDPTLPQVVAHIWKSGTDHRTVYRIRFVSELAFGKIGDLRVMDAEIPVGIPISVGESQFILEKDCKETRSKYSLLPEFPKNLTAWQTKSEAGRQLLWSAKKAAGTPLSIYVAGETGTGKEVIAHLIHAWSTRKSGPFIPIHCGALPLSLAESELFGHVKGAFTGASHSRPGALLQAHGGTLFLDEVGDLPLDIQIKLLRFLENGEIKPVGADQTTRVDVRLLCATHHPLQKLVEEKKFRQDLYYRLASVTLSIPPLRHRQDDIELLANNFAKEFQKSLTLPAIRRLQSHSWPGNVRELRHAMERAIGFAGEFNSILTEEAFDFLNINCEISKYSKTNYSQIISLKDMERHLLLRALKLCSGNRTEAAKLLGVARSTMFVMIKRHKIQGPKSPLSEIDDSLDCPPIRPGIPA